MSRRSSSDGCLFIGRLSKSCRVRDLEDVFEPYGRMSRCEIKYGAEMAYAFVDYEDKRDAEDAIRYENGREVAGSAIIVEWSKGNPRRSGPPSRDSRSRGRDECYRCRRSGHWARDCPDDRNYGYRRPGRRSRSPRRRRSRSRSRSRDRRRTRSRSRSRSRDRRSRDRRSRDRRSRSRSDRSRSRSKSRSRSRSAEDKQEPVNGKGGSRSRSASPASDKDKSE